jgi:hypothetical protein
VWSLVHRLETRSRPYCTSNVCYIGAQGITEGMYVMCNVHHNRGTSRHGAEERERVRSVGTGQRRNSWHTRLAQFWLSAHHAVDIEQGGVIVDRQLPVQAQRYVAGFWSLWLPGHHLQSADTAA